MPFALGMVRKLAAEGREIYAPTTTCCRRETTRSTWRAISSIRRRQRHGGSSGSVARVERHRAQIRKHLGFVV
jgi:hypothetical protein